MWVIQLYCVFCLWLSLQTASHLRNTSALRSCCDTRLFSRFSTVDRIVTCQIGSLLLRYKNLLFACLFKPFVLARSRGSFPCAQSHPKCAYKAALRVPNWVWYQTRASNIGPSPALVQQLIRISGPSPTAAVSFSLPHYTAAVVAIKIVL